LDDEQENGVESLKTVVERLAVMDEKLTEQDLLAASRSGDREALQSLFVQNQKRVFSVALNFFGGDEAAAKDVTQQVFLKIFAKLEMFRGEAEFTTWLYRITINACLDEQRRARRFLSFSDFFGFGDARMRRTQDEKIHRRRKANSGEKRRLCRQL
jgi:RNA polymerase sigma-70 factor (ECF subfamily)